MPALESLYSNEVFGTAGDALGPAKVLNLQFTVEQGKVNLTWDAVTTNSDDSALEDLAGYRIYRKETEGGAFGAAIGTVGGGVTSYEDTSAKDGATYFYAVAAFDDEPDANEGVKSDDLNVKTIPSVPQNLLSTVGDSAIFLQWTDVQLPEDAKLNENLGGYRIYRSETSGVYGNTPLAEIGPEITTYDDLSAENGVQYFYVVTAIDNTL